MAVSRPHEDMLAVEQTLNSRIETHETWMSATGADLQVERVGEGYLGFMFHISTHCAVTKYALERSGVLKRE